MEKIGRRSCLVKMGLALLAVSAGVCSAGGSSMGACPADWGPAEAGPERIGAIGGSIWIHVPAREGNPRMSDSSFLFLGAEEEGTGNVEGREGFLKKNVDIGIKRSLSERGRIRVKYQLEKGNGWDKDSFVVLRLSRGDREWYRILTLEDRDDDGASQRLETVFQGLVSGDYTLSRVCAYDPKGGLTVGGEEISCALKTSGEGAFGRIPETLVYYSPEAFEDLYKFQDARIRIDR